MATQDLATPSLDGRRYRCLTKAVRRRRGSKENAVTPTQVKRGTHWVAARRGWLNIYNDRLAVGSWVIRREDVKAVSAQEVRSLGMKTTVLIVETNDFQYQFGINPWARPLGPLGALTGEAIVPVRSKLGWSFFSAAVRLGFVGYWAWFFLSHVKGR